jgi:hypothetical protein
MTNSPPSGSAMLVMDLNPALTIYGVKGKTYRIESTESVENPNWVELDRVTVSNAVQKWIDPRPATNRKKVYRAVKED